MTMRLGLLAGCLGAIGLLVQPPSGTLLAQNDPSLALSGQVTSTAEGAMEGVLVTAKKSGATIATTVVTDARGRYQFPRARLEPGAYTIRIRATGYDLAAPSSVTIDAGTPAVADLKLAPTHDLAAQLTNAEWLASFPGTDAQKADIRGCAHCHTLELMTRSRHNAAEFVKVVERMSGYPPLAFPLMPQRTPCAARRRRRDSARSPAAELAAAGGVSRTLNLSGGNGVALPAEDRAAAERRRHARDLHRIRSAEAHAATARRDRRLARAWSGTRASVSRSSASWIRGPARSPSIRFRS